MKENPIPRKLFKAIFSLQSVSIILAILVLYGLIRSITLDLLDIPGLGTLNAREISKPGEKWLIYSLYATVPFVLMRWWHIALVPLASSVSAFGFIMLKAYHKVTAQLDQPNLDEETRKMIEEAIESAELQRGFDYLIIGMIVVFLICRLEMVASGWSLTERDRKASGGETKAVESAGDESRGGA